MNTIQTLRELLNEFTELRKTKLHPSSFKAIDGCEALVYHKLQRAEAQLLGVINEEIIYTDEDTEEN